MAPEDRVVNIEVIVAVAAVFGADHAIVGVAGGMAELDGTEGAALLHAHENVINAKLTGAARPLQSRSHDLLMTERFAFERGNPLQGNTVVSSVALNPADVLGGALAEHRLRDDGDLEHVMEKSNHAVLRAKEIQIAIDDNAIEGVINELNPG
jgi:hypothetical protein